MRLSIVVACSKNRVIGKDNQLPWRLPDDLRRFKAITAGYPVIMGRKTFESIGKPLPQRENIVITRQKDFRPAGVQVAGSLEEAIELCGSASEVFIIGGAEIYRLALSRTDRIYLTSVESEIEGDAYFPDWSGEGFVPISEEKHAADERHALPFSFLVLDRA